MILILLLLFQSTCFAGVDFAMFGTEDKQPTFQTDQDAIRFGNEVKWNDEIMRDMSGYLGELMYMIKEEEHAHTRYGILTAKGLRTQYKRCLLALKIMENFKQHGVHGDNAQVGSTVLIGEEPYDQGNKR